jgi:hypothetical protein
MKMDLNRLLAPGVLLLCCCAGPARADLADTPLEPVYHALFSGNAQATWQQLITIWPRLNSDAQRTAWQASLTALVSRQCGKDIPVAAPVWLDNPTLDLVQRDIPLNRIYRVQFNGKTKRRDLRVTLDSPSGEKLLAEAAPRYETGDQFVLESQDLGEPLPAGVYQITVTSGADTWRQKLALPGSAALNWIRREGQGIKVRLPAHADACPAPWVEQSLLQRPDFVTVWSQRVASPEQLRWPPRADAESLWTSVSVIRAEARGGLTLRLVHRLGGPLAVKEN